MPEFCSAERDGHILIVTINRPERMNALHSGAHYELSAIFDEFESDPDQWVAILTGSKNTLKGVGFFVGGALLALAGFQGACRGMAIALALVLGVALVLLPLLVYVAL